jgi:3-methyladenine DNA glycosylase AlkC
LGPFAIGDGLLRYYPELTIKRLINWAEAENEQVRWNVAMAFSAAEAAKHLEAALPILSHLATNNRRFVWRAVASAMRNLGRRAPESVMPVLQKWLKDEKRARPAEAALKFLVVGRGTSQKTSPNMGLNPNSAT